MKDHPSGALSHQISIVIPAYDEALRLPATLTRIGAFFDHNPQLLPAEVLVVDDGSSDGTADAARAVTAPEALTISVLQHSRNQGKGAAVRTGFGQAAGHQILLSDADLATPIEELLTLLKATAERTVVIGSRAVDRQLITVRQPAYRDFMGRIFNLVEQVLAVRGVHDTQCGFKLFPGDLGRALAEVQRLDGFAFDVELLLLAQLWGYQLREVGVHWQHVEASRVQPMRHSAQMLRDLLRLAAWRLGGRMAKAPPQLDPEYER